MIKQYIFVLKNDTFFSQSVGRKQLFWFFEALDCVNVKTKCAVCAVGFKLAENVSGLCVVALSRNLKLTTTLDRAITQNPCYVPFILEQ